MKTNGILKHLGEVLLTSIHNICFHGEIRIISGYPIFWMGFLKKHTSFKIAMSWRSVWLWVLSAVNLLKNLSIMLLGVFLVWSFGIMSHVICLGCDILVGSTLTLSTLLHKTP